MINTKEKIITYNNLLINFNKNKTKDSDNFLFCVIETFRLNISDFEINNSKYLNKKPKSNTYKLYRANRNKHLKNYLYKNPLVKFKNNIRSLIGNSFKRGTNKFNKVNKTEQILGCSFEDFRIYIEVKFQKGMTFENHGLWHLDHIIPLKTAKTQEDVIRLNHYTNFQPLWAKDNLSKSAKIIEQQLILL
jgi:hypothetical protein